MAATGWPLALMTRAYTLVSFLIASAVKIGVYRMIGRRSGRQARHLARVGGWFFDHLHHVAAHRPGEG
jgi:H+-transporting ATPase